MIINKKYVRENYPKGYKYLFSYHNTSADSEFSLYFGSATNREIENEKI
jgi:hypothetical protein